MRAAGEVRAAGAAPRTEDIEATSRRSRVRASIARKGLPYALIAPATLVILAVLGWPLLMLFWLSVQHYGLRELFQHQALAREWVGLLAGNKFQSQMVTVGGVIPNTTSLVSLSSGLPAIFATAAKNSRFTPNSPNWANVESANVLQNMLVEIFTGRSSIADATKAASDKITQILNTSS